MFEYIIIIIFAVALGIICALDAAKTMELDANFGRILVDGIGLALSMITVTVYAGLFCYGLKGTSEYSYPAEKYRIEIEIITNKGASDTTYIIKHK